MLQCRICWVGYEASAEGLGKMNPKEYAHFENEKSKLVRLLGRGQQHRVDARRADRRRPLQRQQHHTSHTTSAPPGGPRRDAWESGGPGPDLRSGSVRSPCPGARGGRQLSLDGRRRLAARRATGDGAAAGVVAPAASNSSHAARLAADAEPSGPGPVPGVARRVLYAANVTGNLANLYCCARSPVYATLDNVTLRKFVNGTKNAQVVKGRGKLQWQEAEVQGVEATDSGVVCCEVRDHLDHVNQSCSPVKMERGPASFYWFVRVAWEGDELPVPEWRDPDGIGVTVDSSSKKSESQPKGRGKPDGERAVLVYWEPPLKEVPSTIPGVARHSTLVLKVASGRAEPGNYTVEVRLGRQAPQRVALRATLVGA
ncbi:Protein of unknown function, partial [Gryllus bimaculatus]